jgi:hypothetical protein
LIQILIAQCLGFVIIAEDANSAIAAPNRSTVPLSGGQSSQLQVTMSQNQPQAGVRLNTPAGIYLISDRQESVVDFFQHRRIVSGASTRQDVDEMIAAPTIVKDQFLAYPSFNDDKSGEVNAFGLPYKLAAISPELIRLWKEKQPNTNNAIYIFLERDSQDPNLYHLVGWVESDRFSFSPGEIGPNPLSGLLQPKELWYQGT